MPITHIISIFHSCSVLEPHAQTKWGRRVAGTMRQAAFGIFRLKHGITERLSLRDRLLSQTASCQRYAQISLAPCSSLLSFWSPLCHIAKTLWPYYHTALSAILKYYQSSCDRESSSNNLKKRKSFNIHLSERWFFSPLLREWVQAVPGRALEADMWEGS